MDTTTESAISEAKIKEGVEIKGKDVILLTAPEICPPAGQLKTEAQDIVGAINELFQSGTGVANGYLRAVIDDNTSAINIVVSDTTDEAYADYLYSYEFVIYSEDIVTVSTVGETTTTSQSFSKRIVTKVSDCSGAVLLVTDYNAETGEILGYTDGEDKQVYTAEWRTDWTVAEAQSNGADSAVIAWVVARNMEQAASFEQQKYNYRRGLKVGADSGGNIVEPWETVDPNIEIDPETSLDIAKGGVWLSFESESSSERRYVKLYISDDEDIGRNVVTGTSWEYRGNIVAEVYDYKGALIATNRMLTSAGSAVWTSELNKANTGRVTSTAKLVQIVTYADSGYASCSIHQVMYDGNGNVLEDKIYGPALNLYLLELGTRGTDFVYTGASNTQPI